MKKTKNKKFLEQVYNKISTPSEQNVNLSKDYIEVLKEIKVEIFLLIFPLVILGTFSAFCTMKMFVNSFVFLKCEKMEIYLHYNEISWCKTLKLSKLPKKY